MGHTCPLCFELMATRQLMDTHLGEKHPENPTPYTCPECPALFKSEKAQKSHYKSKHVTMEVPATFEIWVPNVYNTSRHTITEKLSNTYVARITAFRRQFTDDHFTQLISSPESIDEWVDLEITKHCLQTVKIHLRYLRFLCLFIGIPEATMVYINIFYCYVSYLTQYFIILCRMKIRINHVLLYAHQTIGYHYNRMPYCIY